MTAWTRMTARGTAVLGVFVVAVLVAGWLVRSSFVRPRSSSATVPLSTASARIGPPRPRRGAEVTSDDSVRGGSQAAVQDLPRYESPVRDRARADTLRKTLAARLADELQANRAVASTGKSAAARPSTMPAPVGAGNQAEQPLGRYVGRVMHDQLVPLASECYEALLERLPAAKGKLKLDFSIMGDEDVGGVVVDVALGNGAELGDQEFSVCVRESLYSVVFDPPPPGQPVVTVEQSLDLAP